MQMSKWMDFSIHKMHYIYLDTFSSTFCCRANVCHFGQMRCSGVTCVFFFPPRSSTLFLADHLIGGRCNVNGQHRQQQPHQGAWGHIFKWNHEKFTLILLRLLTFNKDKPEHINKCVDVRNYGNIDPRASSGKRAAAMCGYTQKRCTILYIKWKLRQASTEWSKTDTHTHTPGPEASGHGIKMGCFLWSQA